MDHTEKARRATILLGDISLEVFMLPSGEYQLSKSGVATAIDLHPQYVSRFLSGKSPQALSYKGLTHHRFAVENERTRIDGIPIEVARAFWRYWDRQGNQKASAIIDACIDEALERRADAAFDIQRTEKERNDRLKARLQSKVTRRQLTDAIADYVTRHNELSENSRK